MTITLNITVFNAWATLARTLECIAQLDPLPEQLIVADDGSDASLGSELASWSNNRGLPITHVWHPKRGFRKCELLNKAATVATSDYVLYIDHDCLVRPDFVRRHTAFARPDMIHVGRRFQVMPPDSDHFRPTPAHIAQAMARRKLVGTRQVFRPSKIRSTPPALIEGCNMVIPMPVLREINGFDDEYTAWGFGEDADIVVRGWFAGCRMGVSGPSTAVFHLWHESNASQVNRERFDRAVARNTARCDRGLANHIASKPSRSVQGKYERVAFSD